MPDCLFCKIVNGDIPATIVLKNDTVTAFRDINPQAPTHILIVPNAHIPGSSAVAAEHGGTLAALFAAAQELAQSEGIAASGYRLVFNDGPNAGQTVFHLHMHLLGGRLLGWPPG